MRNFVLSCSFAPFPFLKLVCFLSYCSNYLVQDVQELHFVLRDVSSAVSNWTAFHFIRAFEELVNCTVQTHETLASAFSLEDFLHMPLAKGALLLCFQAQFIAVGLVDKLLERFLAFLV